MKCLATLSIIAAAAAAPTRFLSQSADAKLDPVSSFLEESEVAHKRAEEADAKTLASKEKFMEALRSLSADKSLFDKEGHEYAEKAEQERKEADEIAQRLSILK